MKSISLIGAASYLPETIVDNQFFKHASGIDRHPMFRGTKYRRHMSQGETANSMAVNAIRKLENALNIDCTKDVDALITNVTVADIPFVGSGAAIVGDLGMKPKQVFDLHNGGCVSFLFMLDLAKTLIEAGKIKSAIICNLQTAAGRVCALDDNKKLPQSCVPGDGCGVAFVTDSDINPVSEIITRTHGEYAKDMTVIADDDRYWWEPGSTAFNIDFNEAKIGSVIERGNRLVPEVLYQAIDASPIQLDEIDYLVTNQPNRIFLRNWRESVMLDESQHIQTLADHGNLFGAAIPICLEKLFLEHEFKTSKNLLLGGFSHAGDYSAAAVVQMNQDFYV